ncbi:MAG: uroporphyrinogen decarboxylase family protein [Candidatus Ratteibacteria bacterium]
MTHRERLKRVFKCKEVDRMPIRIWGVSPVFPSEKFKPLCELVEKYDLETIEIWNPLKEEIPPLPYEIKIEEKFMEKEGMKEIITKIKTPKGEIFQIYRCKLDGSPGRVVKNFIEDINDAEKFLSLPDINQLPKIDSYFEFEKRVGERGLILIGIDEAMYSVHRYMGSEVFSFFLYDYREILHKMIEREFKKIENYVKYILFHKIGDGFGYYGPELCIPPLASLNDFDEFVFNYDKKLIDLIHNENKLVWVHCHGDMAPVIKRFIDMGVDCLNPVEPPPVSKITLKEMKQISKGKMCLEGGVEDGAFDTLKPEKMKELVEKIIEEGKEGGGFILCPTSSPDTYPKLLPRHIENYKVFVELGVKLRDY